jgi:ribosomal protein S18 acetylase RimI-like enzyme
MPQRKIKDVVLKNGQSAELVMVTGPEPRWQERLCSYLNAPPRPQGPPLNHFLLTQDLPGLAVRYFAMLCGGEIVGCILTTYSASVGYINSTYVLRNMRRLGVAGALMSALEEDFSQQGGMIRFLSTRTGSPAQDMFEKFGYQAVWERSGRTGMEKHYDGATWDDYFWGDPASLRVEDMTWAHWPQHRALKWACKAGGYHPLEGDFFTCIRASVAEGRTRWKALVTEKGRLVGDGVLRPHDRWGEEDIGSYVLDIYVQPRFQAAADMLFRAALPEKGHIQTFLDGASKKEIAFFQERGFRLEASLRDDFNHHDESTRDIRVYGKTL